MTRVRILKAVWQRGRLLIRIFIVDNHQHFRAELRALLEAVEAWEVCGEAENGWEAIEKHSSMQPHVTVMDFHIPELNGLHTSRQDALNDLAVFSSQIAAGLTKKDTEIYSTSHVELFKKLLKARSAVRKELGFEPDA
jgi:DNA-binding NarL/FixJ family response regulator